MIFDPAILDYKAATSLAPRAADMAIEKEIATFLNGDLWRRGLGYDGPQPLAGDSAGWLLLQRSFMPIPRIQENLRRHVRGVVGQEPLFEVVPPTLPEGERLRRGRRRNRARVSDTNADKVDDAQTQWFDDNNYLTEVLQTFTAHLRGYGIGHLRYDIPPGLASTDGPDRATGEPARGVTASSFEDATRLIYLEVAPRGSAFIHTDPATRRETAVYLFQEDVEGSKKKVKCAQLSWLEYDVVGLPTGRTWRRVVRDNGQNDEPRAYETGGKLFVLEARLIDILGGAFFSSVLRQLQERLCGIATNIKLNCNLAGSPEMATIDIEAPAEVTTNTDGTETVTEVPLRRGPRTVQRHYSVVEVDKEGNPVVDEQGRPSVRSGSVLWRDPVDSGPLIEVAEYVEELIYAACFMRHLTKRIAADSSGAALIQWRADYADSLLETRGLVESVWRDALKAHACLSADIAGDGTLLDFCREARWRVDCRLNAGPLTPEERTEIESRIEKGTLSKESGLILLGQEDAVSELDAINEEDAADIDKQLPRIETMTGILGFDWQDAVMCASGQKTLVEVSQANAAAATGTSEPTDVVQ